MNYIKSLIVLLTLILTTNVWAVATNRTYSFSEFTDGGNNLTTTDFILSGTSNGAAMNMSIDNGVAFGEQASGGACIYKLSVDGTNTGSFELTGISANEFDSSAGVINVSLVGNTLAGGVVQSINTIAGTSNKDEYNTNDFNLANFSGVQLSSFQINFTDNIGSSCSNVDFNSFTIANAQAPVATKAEPTNHPTNFTATTNSTSQITTSWTDATGAVTPDSYLVLCSTSNSFTNNPTDNTAQNNDTSCADGSGVQNIAQGTQTVSWTGLNAGTQYFFKIFPFSNTGSDVNYKTDGSPLTANATTTANINADATLTAATGITEPIDLPTTANSTGNAVNLFDFTITDGGGGDGLSTDVTQIVINTSGSGDFSKVTWRLNGANVSNVVGAYNASAKTITFSSLAIAIADGGSETYILSGFFNDTSSITDNSIYVFSVDGASDVTVSPTGTQMTP